MFFEKYNNKTDGAIRGFDIKSPSVKVISLMIMAVCIIFAIICMYPAFWVITSGFKTLKELKTGVDLLPKSYSFAGFKETWDKLHFAVYYKNSFIMVIGCVICAVIFNGLLAYGLAILKPKGYKIINGLVMWSLLIPATTSIVALFVNINKLGLNNSFIPLWLSYGANAFWVVLFKEFFETLPKELIEAGKLDGCNVLQVFYKIVLPMSKPIIMVIVIFSVTAAWSDFLLPYLLLNGSGKETVMVKLYAYQSARTTPIDMIRAITFALIPPTILFTLFQKRITDGAAGGAVKG
ncbi:MAG: carbohydrate ABC transporter permease [Lachnospiraceae bacterium]|nr:carbohydrate ABC transporter permease [Lachnospiraceae bacterium]